MNCQDSASAALLVKRALQVGNRSRGFLEDWSMEDAEINEVLSLIKGIDPKDTVEMVLASQFVSTHLKAMVKLAGGDIDGEKHGMMLVRLSHQTLEVLQKYRNKGSNINVNYFVKNEAGGQALIQTSIGGNLEKKGG